MTIVGIMPLFATLIASIVGIKGTAGGRPIEAGPPRHAGGQLNPHSGATNDLPIQASHGVFGITGVLEFHEGEAGRIPGDPHGAQGPVVAEGPFQLAFAGPGA